MTDYKDEGNESKILKLILEAGYECCSSVQSVRELISNKSMDEKDIAQVLGCMARTHVNMTGVGTADHSTEVTWNVENFITVVREKAPYLDWIKVIENLDYPHFLLFDGKGLDVLVRAWKACPLDQPFPVQIFFGQWENLKGQLTALYQIAIAPTTVINSLVGSKKTVISSDDFSQASVHIRSMVQPLLTDQLNSLDLIERIIQLADSSVADDVKALLDKILIKKVPELLLMGLLQIDPIVNTVHQDLLYRLINFYLTGNTSSVLVLTKFWKVKPDLFKKSIVDLYNKEPTALTRILAFVHELKILPIILDIQPFLFTIDLAALATRREYLNLEKWLQDKLLEHKDTFAQACLKFLGNKVRAELARQESNSAPVTVPLSMDVVNIIIKIVSDSLSVQEKELLRDIHSTYLQLAQKAPVAKTESAAAITNAATTGDLAFKQEIEDEANSYYERIYNGDITIAEMIDTLKRFSTSADPREQDVFACMIHNLFDEYHFFPKYPDKELAITSVLFGSLIQSQLVSFAPLGIALRCVLDALAQPPNSKMYTFGLQALSQFQSRLPEWPQYCAHLLQVSNLQQANPEVITMVKAAMGKSNESSEKRSFMNQAPKAINTNISNPPTVATTTTTAATAATAAAATAAAAAATAAAITNAATVFTALQVPQVNSNVAYETPSQAIQDKILFTINNVAMNNLESKCNDLMENLKPSSYPWFSHYLVVKRVSSEPNYHELYLLVLKSVNNPLLNQHILCETFANIKILLNSETTVSSSSERTLLKNLGAWLGGMTLAQNKPLLQRYISIKDLLLEGYDHHRLIVIIPFVCKVLEQGTKQTVFVPPNPWVMAILRLLVELYQHADLKLNLKFEIEVLCKSLSIELSSIKPTQVLKTRRQMKPKQPEEPASPFGVRPPENEEEIVIPNLGPYLTFNPQIGLYSSQPNAKRWVLQAVTQSIREIIGPVVERSVAIASVSTRELVTKDFAMESDENKMRKAAHLMAQSLAGSLAMVTCKEPLRTSMVNHVRAIFAANNTIDTEQAALLTVTDNFDLACTVIEKAAMERVTAEVDEALSTAFANRKKHRLTNTPYFDVQVLSASRFPTAFPEPLRPKPNGLQRNQLRIYDDFTRIPRSVSAGQMIDPVRSRLDYLESAPLMDRFGQCMNELERLVAVTNAASFSHLPAQHDIIPIVRQISMLATSSFDKADTARRFAQRVVQQLYKSETQLGREVYVVLLERLCDISPNVGALVTSWLTHADDERKYNIPVTVTLIKANLIHLPEQDKELASLIDSGRMSAIDFTARLIRACLFDEVPIATRQEFMASFEALGRLRGNVPDSVLILMEDLRRRATPQEDNEDHALREHLRIFFAEWVRIYQHPTSSEKILSAFVVQLSQQNIFKVEDVSSLFYRICIETSIEHAIKFKQFPGQAPGLAYQPIDAFAKLVVSLVKLQHPTVEAQDNARVMLFNKILTIVVLVMSFYHEQQQTQFDQRPFLRLFTSLLNELHLAEQQLQTVHFALLSSISHTFQTLQPAQFPGFTFAWFQLISHRLFMPKLLLAENQKGWPVFQRLLISLFEFLEPYLSKAQLKDTTRLLYRGTLRVLLVLLHGFPEFLCDYHYSLCDVIPTSCIQLRNLILSAFPRSMRLPDPFTPNLKVDLLPEIHRAPTILSDYTTILTTTQPYDLKQEIDAYLEKRNVSDDSRFLASLPSRILLKDSNKKYNVPLINAIVFYVGVSGMNQGVPINQGPAITLFRSILNVLDAEGRYLVLSAIANQLRYPSSHTHYFSCVILYLFVESPKEIVQEQITRVLLERLIVNRPHPWGLLITFIELIKNPQYSFWNHSFTRCATDIERLFESVSRSIDQI